MDSQAILANIWIPMFTNYFDNLGLDDLIWENLRWCLIVHSIHVFSWGIRRERSLLRRGRIGQVEHTAYSVCIVYCTRTVRAGSEVSWRTLHNRGSEGNTCQWMWSASLWIAKLVRCKRQVEVLMVADAVFYSTASSGVQTVWDKSFWGLQHVAETTVGDARKRHQMFLWSWGK